MVVEAPTVGFKWPVRADRTITVPARAVWQAISRPGGLELCHPFCATNPVRVWPGRDARDEVHYLNGVIYERLFLAWIDGVGYDLQIGRPGGRTSLVSWRITPIENATCRLRITVCPHVLQHLHSVVRWIPRVLWLRPRLRDYLNSVVRGVDWQVTRGEPVPRNAFGTHPWFSA